MAALAEDQLGVQPKVELPERGTTFENLLNEPEQEGLLRMTKLVEHVFHVPVAYIALLGPDLKVVTRVGSGSQHWNNLQTFPLATALATPRMLVDPSTFSSLGFVSGDLRFEACAPLRSSDDLDLGVLVIADVRERPDFSRQDHETLIELAEVLARKMELQRIASQARQAELSWREAEHRFRNIADSAPVMIIHTGADGAASFVNKAWTEFTGRTMEEELNHTADTVHPDYRKPVLNSYREALRNREPATEEFPMRRHDGAYRWMRAQGIPRFRDDGNYVGYIGCFVDITDHRSATLALRKQVLCTAAVAEAARAFFLILDAEGRVEQVSPLCRRTSARDPAEMCGRFIWKVCDAAISGGAAIREAVRQASSTRQPVQASTTCPLREGKGSAELDWTFTPVVSQQDEVLAVTAVTFGLCAGPGCACGPA
ncbi:MAG TPA: PAS domain S-box protein [Bryobacteraceae bacterium]|jgi:PAS domain S-box-containing protein|nr:PAS domain S-box protein [Bryobacteraceae bacterium]